MYTITFYSFKGGVGRTMALVNVAAELAKMGRKVLVVDFDLEAPGLETFERLRPDQPRPGLVEYVTEYMRSKRSPDVREYIYEPPGKIGKKDGQLWVMPAGRRDRDYLLALYRLDWRKLYEQCDGFVFFEDLKAQWEQLEFKPDYVLIDSRTGDTDVKGICTRQLPDAVVLLFFPNEQNLVGLKRVCREIQRERTEGLQKNIRLHFIMSNVPDLYDEDNRLRRRLNEFSKALDIRHPGIPIIHHSETLPMLDQPVFVLQHPHSRLAAEYRLVVRALQINNAEDPDGALLFLREEQKPKSRFLQRLPSTNAVVVQELENGRIHRLNPPDPIHEHMLRIGAAFPDDPNILLRIAEYYQRHNEWHAALKSFNSALNLQPDLAEIFFLRGLCRRQLRDDVGAAQDLLEYLRLQQPISEQAKPNTEDLQRASRNEQALMELLSVSVESFQKSLELPPIPIRLGTCIFTHKYSYFLLYKVVVQLFRQRRFEHARHLLETTIKVRRVDNPDAGPSRRATASHAFLFAMARWGETGQLDPDLCSEALRWLQPILDEPGSLEDIALPWFQEAAFLFWGIGDNESAEAALNDALACLDACGEIIPGVSFWTFQETTPHEYRHDCEEMRRMIRGEPIRPAFLGSPSPAPSPTK